MFNFNFGHKPPDKKQLLIVGAVLGVIITSLSQCTRVPQERLWGLLDEAQRCLFPNTIINEVIIQNPGLIERRVVRDVDRAIRDYEYQTRNSNPSGVSPPKLIEKNIDTSVCYSKECQKLGGEMRLCAPWVADCIDKKEENQN